MNLKLDEVFEIVRLAISSDDIPREEITLESHLYFDLQLTSVDFMAMVTIIEMEYDISVPPQYWEMIENDKILSSDSWETYRLITTASLREYLDKLEFSGVAKTRVGEIEQFCRNYDVKPFTVGFVCACIIHIAGNAPD